MSIECLKCENEVVKFELPDHIAAHFNYFPHLCNDCYYSCYSSQKAVEHEVMSNHSVLQNKAKNIYMHNLCLGIYKDCLLAKKYGHKYVLLYGFTYLTGNASTAAVSINSAPSLDVAAPNNLVDHVAKSPSPSKNVVVHSEEDVVYLSSVQRKVSSSDVGDDVLYEPPEEKSYVREKEYYPEMEGARKGPQPSTSLVDKDSDFVDAQSTSDRLECQLCGHKVSTKKSRRRHVISVHLKLQLACPFCHLMSSEERSWKKHLITHGVNPKKPEGEEGVAVIKERIMYCKQVHVMFERCFPPRIVQNQLRVGKQLSKDMSMRVQSTIEDSKCFICNAEVKSDGERRAHASEHHLKRSLVCPRETCGFTTFIESSMSKHIKEEHKIAHFGLNKIEMKSFYRQRGILLKKLKPVLQMCFPYCASFDNDLRPLSLRRTDSSNPESDRGERSEKTRNSEPSSNSLKVNLRADSKALQTSPLNNSSSPLSSGKNRKRKAKKALRTLCLDSSALPLSSGRKKKNRKRNSIKSKSDLKRRNDEAEGAEVCQPDAKKRRDSNISSRSEISLTHSSSLPMMLDVGVPAKQSKNQNETQVLPDSIGIKIEQV